MKRSDWIFLMVALALLAVAAFVLLRRPALPPATAGASQKSFWDRLLEFGTAGATLGNTVVGAWNTPSGGGGGAHHTGESGTGHDLTFDDGSEF